MRHCRRSFAPILLLVFLGVLGGVVDARAASSPFRDVTVGELPVRGPASGPARGDVPELPLPRNFRALAVDVTALEILLARAPLERSPEAASSPLLLAIPYPDGRNKLFRVEESPILEAPLAAQFPELRTYTLQGVDDPTASGRLSRTPLGVQALVLSASGSIYLDPFSRGDDRFALSYWKREATREASAPFRCEVPANAEPPLEVVTGGDAPAPRVPSGTQLRTYRLALAATGEYTAAVCAPNPAAVSCGLAAMVVSMNRVVAIYEREVAIRMVMVANNNLVVYTNGATDPYTNTSGSTMLGENQSNLNSVIGSANYDIGHVFSTGGGGVANLAVPCTASKARGVTGQSVPIGDPFDVDYVAHEMGHQFGGSHTFNGTTNNCGGNRSASSAYEPGSGTTIMAYAGICGAEDLQPHSDDTFHTRSFDQIVGFSTGATGNSCAVTTATGNRAPVVDAGASFTIPIQTPFTLTGSANDPDGDAVTYLWEEFDLGTAAPPNDDVAATRPILRTFVPLTVPSRTFPRLADLLANTSTIGEVLPTRTRTMTFRLTARDNRAGGGGVDFDSTTVAVSAAAGPFLVTQPNTAVTWTGGSVENVAWNVAGTTAAPVSCANVAIDLSTDGGLTFSTPLLASTPNDGSEAVTVPNLASNTARVRVSCVGNIFFDLSNVNFSITAPQPTGFHTLTPCRLVDTRDAAGPFGGPALAGGAARTFAIEGGCGVPPEAVAVAINVTVVLPTAAGSLRVYPSGIAPPLISTLNWKVLETRANNAVLGLDGPNAGSLDVFADFLGAGTAHFLIDVVGYFD